MFVGVHERQLDDRGRVALPSAYRNELGDHCYLFFGDDGCVSVRSVETFEAEAADMVAKAKRGDVSRNRLRAFASSASEATIDKQGRVTLDARLRDHAGLADLQRGHASGGITPGRVLLAWERVNITSLFFTGHHHAGA